MKALILAAGLGTRLKPFSLDTPKPLFPLFGQPNLDVIIHQLEDAGCKAIAVNTYHLHDKIEDFLSNNYYHIPVHTRFEPEILGTGGAIKNLQDFWDDEPFFVINGDVATDLSLVDVYRFHVNHPYPVTLVLCDDLEFNTVGIHSNGHIKSFGKSIEAPDVKNLTFTGIQVLDSLVLDFIPENQFSSSIDAFKKMMACGHTLCAYTKDSLYWKDIGNPKRYMEAVCDKMAPVAFEEAFGHSPSAPITRQQLKGDGSDRKWYRVEAPFGSLVVVDHGIQAGNDVLEFDSFVHIGKHLYEKGVPVPKIILHDRFSGLVFLEDLGDTHLQDVVQSSSSPESLAPLYQSVIEEIIRMSVNGAVDFNPAWTYQSKAYDPPLILEKECRYFTEAFLGDYLNMDVRFEDYLDEFRLIADGAVTFSTHGFMHRDMQSRNIMIKDGQCRFIDFQGGRTGPVQYDLASLLIDPYVQLPAGLQTLLLNYAYEKMNAYRHVERQKFFEGYDCCALCRNFQILGAFGFLSRRKGKTEFAQYVPPALNTLKRNLSNTRNSRINRLKMLVENLPDMER